MTNGINIDFWTNIGIAITAVFGGIVMSYNFIKSRFNKTKETKEEVFDIGSTKETKQNQIHEMLSSLRIYTNSDRAQIGQFHNGGKFLDGAAMKKISISHESCSPGISMEFYQLQGVLATLFWDMIELIKENNSRIRFTESLPDETILKTYNESKNIKAFSILPVRKQTGLIFGFIRIEWNDIHQLPDNYEDCTQTLEQYRSFIELELTKNETNL